ncbi:MAG: menaquinol oxidoreductase [Deltaproteobacteria bacterium]|nr:MAG: menaquinol oxidoreductase [Deltaproteobacteria bacterium]
MKRADTEARTDPPAGRSELQASIEARIRRLELTAGNGLWGMVLFLLVSFAAFDGFALLPDLPAPIREQLGTPPPVDLISLALVVYAFSGIVLTLARMTSDTGSYRGFMHAAFFAGFYSFYHLSGGLPDNFWAVFLAGTSVMGLESYHLWTRHGAAIRKQQALLADLRAGRPLVLEDDEGDQDQAF